MGRFDKPRDNNPIRVPPSGKNTIGEKKAAASQSKNRKIVLINVCAVAVVLLISIIFSIWFFFGRDTDDKLILNNVMVSGINLGGMTRDEAKQALHTATDNTYTTQDMVVELPDATLTFSPADTGAKLDVDAVVEAAYDYGRTGSKAEREAIRQAALTSTHHIPLLNYLTLNLDYIKQELDAYGVSFNSSYIPSSVEFDIEAPILDAGNEKFVENAPCQVMTLTLGAPGRYLNMDQVYNDVLDAYSFNTFLVTAEMGEDEQLPEPIDVMALYEQYRVDAQAAYLDLETSEVVPEIYGYDFDLNKALEKMEQAQYGDTVEVPFRYLLPETDAKTLSALLFRDVLGAYETKHTANENRNTNLKLACAAINGKILSPGETFDFNTVVGQRTSAKGYKEADAYSSGETVKTLGGGICQVSSTLYYCTLIADLQIVNRSPHSYVSSYMPMGMDATVSWGGPHFTFKNSTNYPIRIEAKVEDGYVKIQLIGTDEKDYYVEMEYEVIGSESPETIYRELDKDNPDGYKDGDVITTAYKGYTVRTYKLKYDKETKELISREEDRVSRYKKRDKVVAKVEQPTEPPTEPVEPTEPKPTEPKPTEPKPTEPKPTDPPATEPPAPAPTDPPVPAPTNPPAAETPAENPAEGSGEGA